MRQCKTCLVDKPESAFPTRKMRDSEWTYPNCRDCKNRLARKYLSEHPAISRASAITKHGVSVVWYLAQYQHQVGRCEIRHKPPGRRGLYIDHDHITGKVRGLLCTRCNFVVGSDSHTAREFLRAVSDYAERHDQVSK